VLEMMDGGAESPQETRTRLLLVGDGLPPPQTQIVVDGWRVDMLRHGRAVITRRTCAALREAGAEWPVIARSSGERAA